MENSFVNSVSEKRGKFIVCAFAICIFSVFAYVWLSFDGYFSTEKNPDSISANFSVRHNIRLDEEIAFISPDNKAHGYRLLEWSMVGLGREFLSTDTNPTFEIDTPGTYILSLAAYPTNEKSDKWRSFKDTLVVVTDNRLRAKLQVDPAVLYFPGDKCEIRFKSEQFQVNRSLRYGQNDFALPRFLLRLKVEIVVTICHLDSTTETWQQRTFAQEKVISDSLLLKIGSKKSSSKN